MDGYRAKPDSDMKRQRNGAEARLGVEGSHFLFPLALIRNMHRLISAAAARLPLLIEEDRSRKLR